VRRHARLGAGFPLAMKDLELRGAGSLLGPQQSGHVAAIGFGLYCQLLRRSVARLKGETVPALVDVTLRLDFLSHAPADGAAGAAIPYDYIEEEGPRLAMYTRLAQCASEADVESARQEFRDRFGPPPLPVERLLRTAELRVLAAARGIEAIEVVDGKVRLKRGGDYMMEGGRFPRLAEGDVDQRLARLRHILLQTAVKTVAFSSRAVATMI